MQQYKHRQLDIDFQLTNNMLTARRIMENIPADIIPIMNQVITLLGYKYLSQNLKNNKEDLGYELHEDSYYENLLIDKGNVIDTLKRGIEQITQENENTQAADIFYDLFNLVDFDTFKDNETWLLLIEIVERLCSGTIATLGEIMIFLTKYVNELKLDPKIKGTPTIKPTYDIIELMTINQNDVKNIYDPYADEATLLAEIGNVISVENYYGQHPNIEKCILAKMTLLTNDVNYKNIFIKCNDITEPIHWNVKFDICVSIPPFRSFSERKNRKSFNDADERFKPYVPKRFNELAYILDMLYHLNENGTVKILVPPGVISSPSDKNILKYLVDNELISSIIALSDKLYGKPRIPTVLLIINKKLVNKGIYYLNMTNAKIKILPSEMTSIENIDEYDELLANKTEKELISKTATLDDIQENNYNLGINRYVDLVKLEMIDVEKTISNIEEINMELEEVDEELNEKIISLFKN